MTIEKDWDQQFYFESTGDGRYFIFNHQTAEQKGLMNIYSGEHCLLIATHRTIKYILYLFFIVVKTNADYQVCICIS